MTMQHATRTTGGLIFECPSPSVWLLVGAPVTLAYDGRSWRLSMTDRDGVFREGVMASRDEAIRLLSKAYGLRPLPGSAS